MRGDGAAEIARQEHSPECACPRPAVEDGAHEQQDAKRHGGVSWPAELNSRFEHDWQPHQFHASIHQHEEDDETTERVADAKLPYWRGRNRAGVDHVCILPLLVIGPGVSDWLDDPSRLPRAGLARRRTILPPPRRDI